MVAMRQVDVDDLNERARHALRAGGELPNVGLDVAGRQFAVGDRVVALENARRLGVLNGQRGTITIIDLHERGVRVALDAGRDVDLPSGYLGEGRLAHAYAITGHKAQGMTADRCYVLGDEALYREWGYVALSRGRDDNTFYIVAAEDPEARDLGQVRVEATDPIARVARALERSGAKTLAMDTGTVDQKRLDLRELSDEGVRRERDELARIISQGPPDPTDQFDRLREQWAPIEHALTGTQAELAGIRVRLDGRGLHRVERTDLQHAALGVESRIRGLEERLAELVPRVREVGERHRAWWEWAVGAEPVLRRYLDVEAELADRGREAARWQERSPGGEVIDLAGRRPDGVGARGRWRRAVEMISRHALRWGVDAPDRGVGERVHDLDVARQRQAREVERALLEVTRGRELSRNVERDVGRSL